MLIFGCAVQPAPHVAVDAASATRGGVRGQWLFRAELGSPEGELSLRLALRQASEREFELAASDALGQGVWRLVVRDEAALWSDLARRRFCRLDSRATPHLQRFRAPLPAADLAALLRGALPGAPEDAVEAPLPRRAEVRDAAGRSWTGEWLAGRWTSWTLWSGGRPRLWWREEGPDRILSGNDPAFQLRWRETARGELPGGAVVAIDPPAGFVEERCGDAAAP